MAYFKYSGRDSGGAAVSGQLDAASIDDVAEQLFGNSITPIEIKELDKKAFDQARQSTNKTKQNDSEEGAIQKLNNLLGADKIEIDELIMFSRQMYSLTKAGLPLDRAIKGLATSITNTAFQNILNSVHGSLESGTTVATALGQHPKVFSQLFISLIHVGENTGRLDLAFLEVSKYLELDKDTRKQVKSATRYPIFVLVAISIALAVITVFVIPVFSDAFARLGADLPWQTVILIDTSNFVVTYWPLILLGIGGSVFGFFYWSNTDKGLLAWDRRKLSIPLVGEVFEKVALARFARTFSMVLNAGMPIIQGLTVVSGAVGNAYISHNVNGMREGVERGESLYNVAAISGMFTPLVMQMIAVGEETGAVDDLLAEVADFYTTEVEYDIRRLSDAVEPILITFIAGLVLILALGVFLPIWDLSSAAQGG
jgi:MSHA biogenesis protein MshG